MQSAREDLGEQVFRLKTFLIRAASALVALLIIFFLYLQFQGNSFKILVWLAIILGSREIENLLLEKRDGPWARWLLTGSALTLGLLATFYPKLFLPAILVLMMSGYICLQVDHRLDFSPEDMRSLLMRWMVGLFYVGVIPSLTLLTLNLERGAAWFYTMLAMVFAGDTLAYLVGVKFGKTKLIPIISPKKTLEGALGGVLGTLLAAVLLKEHLPEMSWALWLPFALVAAVFAQSGDFFESMLKRAVSLKDSGGLMPGHGGLLDRIDGVLFAIPLFHLLALSLER